MGDLGFERMLFQAADELREQTGRRLVPRKLKKYGYPPDKAGKPVETVLKQAELLAADWAA